MNKKGNFGTLLFFFILVAVLLVLGFMFVIGSAVINLVADEVVPEITSIGQVGAVNISEVSGYTLNPINDLIQSFTWISGVLYIFALLGLVGLSVAYRTSMHKIFIGLFLAFAFLLIIGSMFMSNIYEDFYDDSGDLGDRLKEHQMLSYMVLYSPMIFTILIFICGIILFSGTRQEGFV